MSFLLVLSPVWSSQVEKSPNRLDRLVYPPLPPKTSTVRKSGTTNGAPAPPTDSRSITKPVSTCPPTSDTTSSTPRCPIPVPKPSPSPLAKPTFLFPPQTATFSPCKPLSSVTLRSPARNPALAPHLQPFVDLVNPNDGEDNHNFPTTPHIQNNRSFAPTWTCLASTKAPPSAPPSASSLHPGPEILPLLKVTFSPNSDPVPCPASKASADVVSAEVRQRIKEILLKYSQGLWAHALPKLLMDTYKTPFPEHVLNNLSLLLDICTVEYPVPHDKKKVSTQCTI